MEAGAVDDEVVFPAIDFTVRPLGHAVEQRAVDPVCRAAQRRVDLLLVCGQFQRVVTRQVVADELDRRGELVAGRVTALRGLMAAFRGQMFAAE